MTTVDQIGRELPAGPDPVAVFRALGDAEGAVLFERPGVGAVVGLDPVTVAVASDDTVGWTSGPIRAGLDSASLPEVLRAVAGTPAACALGGDAFRRAREPDRYRRRERPAGPAAPPHGIVVFPGTLIAFDADRVRLTATSGARLDELAEQVAAAPALAPLESTVPVPDVRFDSEIPDDAYRDLIEAAHRRVVAGEAQQVTISRRFVAPAADPFAVYRVLRATNPSPYHFLFRLPGVTLVGASPQGLVEVSGRQVSIPVIAGTRRRGAGPAQDAALAAELLADPKERAEHAMLVDLARADLAGLADPDTVRVADGSPEVRRYSRVMHLVSEVTGTLASGRTALDALATALPSGTVAGTPRAAALRLIDEIEPRPRGLYGGGVGWLSAGGDIDFCLGIRTLQFRDGKAYCQAGAGVVAGSMPDREVRESRDKASALFAALAAAAATGARR